MPRLCLVRSRHRHRQCRQLCRNDRRQRDLCFIDGLPGLELDRQHAGGAGRAAHRDGESAPAWSRSAALIFGAVLAERRRGEVALSRAILPMRATSFGSKPCVATGDKRAAVVRRDPDDQAGGVQQRVDARQRAFERAGIGQRRQVASRSRTPACSVASRRCRRDGAAATTGAGLATAAPARPGLVSSAFP